jgi:hypothetical protein
MSSNHLLYSQPNSRFFLEDRKVNLPMQEGIFAFTSVLRHFHQAGIPITFPSKYQMIQSYVEGLTDELPGEKDTEIR